MASEHARSDDGTTIAFDRVGAGAPVVIVAGALQSGATYRPLADALASSCTAFVYDRRGRGGSGDTAPYAVEREIEDLAAIIAEAGGRAAVYGHSSGAALVLHAAARGLPIDGIVLHEPPFGTGSTEEERAEQQEAEHLSGLLAKGRRAEALTVFLSSMGMPAEVVDHLSRDPSMLANAPTLLSDPYEVMSGRSRGGATPVEQAGTVTTPALVLAGGASPDWMVDASRKIAAALPNGRLHVLDGQEHLVAPEVLAPVVEAFVIDAVVEGVDRSTSA